MQLIRQVVVALAVALATTAAASSARAWTPNQVTTTITQVIAFQNGSPQVLIRTASNDWCYFDSETSNGKALMSIVLGAYLSGRTVNVTCFDETINVAGFDVHNVHRLWLM